MSADYINRNRIGDRPQGGQERKDAFDRAYMGAKLEAQNYGTRMMAENSGQKPEYNNTFSDFDAFRNVDFGMDGNVSEQVESSGGDAPAQPAHSAPLFDTDSEAINEASVHGAFGSTSDGRMKPSYPSQ